jgi:N-methylhydantoinase B
LKGGLSGRCGRFLLNPNTPGEKVIPSKVSGVLVRQGDVISIQTAGAGGFGSPLERDIELVANDYRQGKISYQEAHDRYGVVLTEEGEVDQKATAMLRGQMNTKEDK